MGKRKISDFEQEVQRQPKKARTIDSSFFKDYGFTDKDKAVCESAIKKSKIFDTAYSKGRFDISTKYRKKGLTTIAKQKQAKKQLGEVKSRYDPSQELFDVLMSEDIEKVGRKKEKKGIIHKIENYSLNSLAEEYNTNVLSTLFDLSQTFNISMQVFPEIDPNTFTRSDCYDPQIDSIEICPSNFKDTPIAVRNDPHILFAHELAHALDYNLGKSKFALNPVYASADALEERLKEFYPGLNSTPAQPSDIEEAKNALKAAARICSDKIIEEAYELEYIEKQDKRTKKITVLQEGVIDKQGNIDKFHGAMAEFLSFHVENTVLVLGECRDKNEFREKYNEHINKRLQRIKQIQKLTLKAKLFAIDARDAYTKDYVDRLSITQSSTKDILETVQEVFDTHIDTVLGEISDKVDWDIEPNVRKVFDEEIKRYAEKELESKDFETSVDEITDSLIKKANLKEQYESLLNQVIKGNKALEEKLLASAPQKFHDRMIKRHFVTSKEASLDSYIRSQIKEIVLAGQKHYFEQRATEIAEKIAKKSQEQEQTLGEIESSKEQLSQIEDKIKQGDETKDWQRDKNDLEKEISTTEANLREIGREKQEVEQERYMNATRTTENKKEEELNKTERERASKDVFGK